MVANQGLEGARGHSKNIHDIGTKKEHITECIIHFFVDAQHKYSYVIVRAVMGSGGDTEIFQFETNEFAFECHIAKTSCIEKII